VEPPSGYVVAFSPPSIDVPDPRSCQEMIVRIRHDGRISGRVVDARGSGVASLRVHVEPLVVRKDDRPDLVALTRSDGTYEVTRVPPGRFRVTISGSTDARHDCVHETVWHPGTDTIGSATVVKLGPAERTTIGDLVLPDTLSFTHVSGVVVGSDGGPVTGARVFLTGESRSGAIVNGPATTDLSGLFTIAAPTGRQCRIFAELTAQDGPRTRTAASEAVRIAVTPELPPQRLVLRRQY
jgi:hypothetical protein